MRTMTEITPMPDDLELKLPCSVGRLLKDVGDSTRHPGLQLDKLSLPGNQEAQLQGLRRVCSATGDESLLRNLSRRRAAMLDVVGAARFRAATAGPLTLHLARASGLENAGLHLHPLYGFACLPGSGLKGVARAWAETVWLADQADQAEAWERIRAVFGWATGSEKDKAWRPDGMADPEGDRAGAVVFHDAWPAAWPQLQPDIVNNHHGKYYDGSDAPRDRDDPGPVYFLSVAPGARFDFALSSGSGWDDTGTNLTAQAAEWLQAALVHGGAGAKTNAGYGRFRLENVVEPPAPRQARETAEHTLKLATPAFLAGANQQREDCDLRSATLRGLLRWWWRTMHAAHLEINDLRRLETAVWGDARNGAALAVAIQGRNGPAVKLFDYKDGRKKEEFRREHDLERPPTKQTQGLFYLAYGMDETVRVAGQKQKRQRYYVDAGADWIVTLSARRCRLPSVEREPDEGQRDQVPARPRRGRPTDDEEPIAAADVLRQGEAALWLLCRCGGVGSKARKGFGSFADVVVESIVNADDCKRRAADFRRAAGLAPDQQTHAQREDSRPRRPPTSSLEDLLTLEVDTPWRDWWFALDRLGLAVQAFARRHAHDERKVALGLPRKIHGPLGKPMNHQDSKSHRHPIKLSAGGHGRHAAPIHYHLAPRAGGALTVRMTAFPSADLPDIETSRDMLRDLRAHLKSHLERRERRTKTHAQRGTNTPAVASPSGTGGRSSVATRLPKAGDHVDAVLLPEKTKKGGWKAKHEPSGMSGPIQNSTAVPGDAEPGRRVSLVVASASLRELAFRWPMGPAIGPSRSGGSGRGTDPEARQSRRRRRR